MTTRTDIVLCVRAADCLPVLLVDSEQEALLCPYHQLVRLDGSPIDGEPMLATAGW